MSIWFVAYLLIGLAIFAVRTGIRKGMGLPRDNLAELCLQVLTWPLTLVWFAAKILVKVGEHIAKSD